MTKWLQNLKKDERGLTLIELLAVVVILAIVAAIAFVLIGNVIENSKKDAVVSDALQAVSAAKLLEATGSTIDVEAGVTNAELTEEELMGALIDPWTKVADTMIVTVTKNEAVYSVSVSGTEDAKCDFGEMPEADLLEAGREACD